MDSIVSSIISSKTKVAVLRVLVAQNDLPARQLQAASGKSWGAVKGALDSLQEAGIIVIKKGKWHDEINLNVQNIFFESISQLFDIERKFPCLLGGKLFSYALEAGVFPISFYLFSPDHTLYLVSRSVDLSEKKRDSCLDYLNLQGLPDKFSLKLMDSDSFTNLWYEHKVFADFVLLHGVPFPFHGVQRAYDFFDIENPDSTQREG